MDIITIIIIVNMDFITAIVVLITVTIDPMPKWRRFQYFLPTFKLALLASFVVKYSFEGLTQVRG